MDIQLLKIFRRRASKDICLRRQAGNRYEVVCQINEDNTLGCFTKPWIHINHPKASITFKMCIPNGSTFVRKADYNQSQDEYCIPFPTNFLRLDEAQMELYKIRRGYIMYYLVPEFCKKLPIK